MIKIRLGTWRKLFYYVFSLLRQNVNFGILYKIDIMNRFWIKKINQNLLDTIWRLIFTQKIFFTPEKNIFRQIGKRYLYYCWKWQFLFGIRKQKAHWTTFSNLISFISCVRSHQQGPYQQTYQVEHLSIRFYTLSCFVIKSYNFYCMQTKREFLNF